MQTPAAPEDDAVPPMTLFDGNTLVFTTVIAAGSIALPVLALSDWLLLGHLVWPRYAVAAAAAAAGVAGLALSRRGWWDTAGAVLVGALWLAITLYCFHSGYGLHSSLVMAYLPCALYAMLFFGPRTALCTLGLTLAALALLHVAEESGVVGGAQAVARTGTSFAYLCGIVSALVGTLAGGYAYDRRVRAEAARLHAQARGFHAELARERAHAQAREAGYARIADQNAELAAHAHARAERARRGEWELEVLRRALAIEIPARIADAVRQCAPEAGSRLARDSLAGTTAKLKDLSKLLAIGRDAPGREPLDVGELAREAASAAGMEVDIEPGLFAHADRALVSELIRHLLVAVRSPGESPKRVQVGSGTQDGRRVLFVRERAEELTDRRRHPVARDPSIPGEMARALGVDLAIARRIVECHGGEFHAHGAASGGLAVIFTLDGAADPAPRARQ